MATKQTTETDGKTYVGDGKDYVDIVVPVSAVKVDFSWNTRKRITYTGQDFDVKAAMDVAPQNALAAAKSATSISELAKLIKKDGLMNRPIVRDLGDGKFFLVAGFRRWMALTDVQEGGLGWKEIPIRAKRMTDSEAVRVNLEENQARKELTAPEIADGVARYARALESEGVERKGGRVEGTKGTAGHVGTEGMAGYGSRIASEMHMSKSAVNLYLRIHDKVHPQIVKVWTDPASPSQRLCTLARLDQWSKMPANEQLKRFRNLEKTGSEDSEAVEPAVSADGVEGSHASGGEGGQSTPTLRMVKYDQAAEALAFFKEEIKTCENPVTKQWMNGVIKALEWSMNKVKVEHKGKQRLGSLGEYNPWEGEETEEAESNEDKAQDKALAKAEAKAAKLEKELAEVRAKTEALKSPAKTAAEASSKNGNVTPTAKA